MNDTKKPRLGEVNFVGDTRLLISFVKINVRTSDPPDLSVGML